MRIHTSTMLEVKNLLCVGFLIIVFVVKSIQFDYVVVKDRELFGPRLFKRNAMPDVPKIREFLVTTNVANRFAETKVISKVENSDNYPKQTAFSVVIPEKAFISGFYMETEGKRYKAFVKANKIARSIYSQSISNGHTAAHVAVSTRFSNRFTVKLNVEPFDKVIFCLTYEELLERINGQYEILTNIQPGQLVKKLKVEIKIKESQPIAFVRTPSLRSGSNYNNNVDPHALVTRGNNSVTVVFQPSIQRQLEFACEGFGNKLFDGFAGQFVVKYDVVRNNEGGETMYQDGYFVNFFAPVKQEPIPKYLVFILDTSGSMDGQKLIQLKDAMKNILPQIDEYDLITIIEFETSVYIWDLNAGRTDIFRNFNPEYLPYGYIADKFKTITPAAFPATEANVNKLKSMVDAMYANQLTNSIGALEVGLLAVSKLEEHFPKKYKSVLVFLTDGIPVVGISDTQVIIQKITDINKANYNVPIISLSFGSDADWNFLDKLSRDNRATARKIPVGADSSALLQDFYQTISQLTLTDLSFKNVPNTALVTKTYFPFFFNGSEIIVAGKGVLGNATKPISVSATAKQGQKEFEAKIGVPVARLEKVWAYLTVKQLAEEYKKTNNNSLFKFATEIAMNYSLVTEFTSLVVLKPNIDGVTPDIEDAFIPNESNELPMCQDLSSVLKTTERDDPTTTSIPTIDDDALLEVINGVTETPATTLTPQITTTESTTTTEPTTTRKLTCNESTYGCCHDGITFSLRPNADGCDPIPKAESCSLPQDGGSCNNITFKWYYSTEKHGCKLFKYGGCGGNDNRFSSKENCQKTCVDPQGKERCKLPIDLGYGHKPTLHWFYNKTSGECVKYMYGGYLGNSNRFVKKLECLKMCNPPGLQKTLVGICKQPLNRGSKRCQKFSTNFYFDISIGQCKKFWFNGCGGNDNRFETLKSCEDLCVYSENKGICQAPPVRGFCQYKYESWYYNSSTSKCQPFIYSGCGGNKNKFKTKKGCENVCSNSP
ncbi:inter-alpha-trypsin inhibitor heavy chain H4-like isoform X1 [Diorhabda carinulata]|uniref:inter-alpha-trypsin inhibitor heavy chain H4-like isoform X1 n=1 Tax=Diorhabda carinulata TaxID=1163345 RepID=UPI0025A27DDB|nr:inter-alpha-trypsin inhibitor heavy chain H4-like isoform X1 [Diorhabda carinulata]